VHLAEAAEMLAQPQIGDLGQRHAGFDRLGRGLPGAGFPGGGPLGGGWFLSVSWHACNRFVNEGAIWGWLGIVTVEFRTFQ